MLTFEEVLTALDKGSGGSGDARVARQHGARSGAASPAMEVNDCGAP